MEAGEKGDARGRAGLAYPAGTTAHNAVAQLQGGAAAAGINAAAEQKEKKTRTWAGVEGGALGGLGLNLIAAAATMDWEAWSSCRELRQMQGCQRRR